MLESNVTLEKSKTIATEIEAAKAKAKIMGLVTVHIMYPIIDRTNR